MCTLKKGTLLLFTLFMLYQARGQDAFVTTWKTNNAGVSDSLQVTIPTNASYGYDFVIDWGDGTVETVTSQNPTHTYDSMGTYQVAITGTFPSFYLNNAGDTLKLLSIDQWGDIEWKTMEYAFYGAENMVMTAIDTPNLSSVKNMTFMFREAKSFNGSIGSWDVSHVTNMHQLFWYASSFDQDISNWDVSNVTTMRFMFGDTPFNQDIGNWDVSSVTNMEYMFTNATQFNQDISHWDVSNVTNMAYMFGSATAFNQDISGWDVSNVTNMYRMFWNKATSFDQNLGAWDVSNVTNMDQMFYGPTLSTANYDSTLIGWASLPALQDSVVFGARNNTYCLSEAARAYLIDSLGWTITDAGISDSCHYSLPFLTTWKTDNAGSTASNQIRIPTNSAYSYDFTIDWGDGTVETITSQNPTHTYDSAGTYQVAITGTFPSFYTNYSGDRLKLLSVDQWGSIEWETMLSAFYGAENLTMTAEDTPDLSHVTSLAQMFALAKHFNGDLSAWDVSHVTSLYHTFFGASAFNQAIGSWDVSHVTNMSGAFCNATAFNQDLSSWDVSQATTMTWMFYYASDFSQNLNSWDVSNVTDMSFMFFNCDFNGAISNWNTGNVSNMRYMFMYNYVFNQNIQNWDVSNVTNMEAMFDYALSFDQNLSMWDVSQVEDMAELFTMSALSTFNYDSILIGWAELPLQSDVTLGADAITYYAGASARSYLIDSLGWTITDGGESASCSNAASRVATVTESVITTAVYPNPTSGKLQVLITNNPVKKVAVYDLQGRLVHSYTGTDSELDLSHLTNGTYVLDVSWEGGHSHQLVVKN